MYRKSICSRTGLVAAICLSEARISDPGGRLLAHGTATMLVLDSLQLKGQASLPPKFLD